MATKKKINVNIGVGDSTEATKRVAKAIKAISDKKQSFSEPVVGVVNRVGRDSYGKAVLYMVVSGAEDVVRATIKRGEYSEYTEASSLFVGKKVSLIPATSGVEVVEFVDFI